MEIFLDIIRVCLMAFLAIVAYAMSRKISKMELELEFYKRKFILTLDTFGEDIDRLERAVENNSKVVDDFHRSLLAQKESEATRPIRPNNWDSIKEAFKGPVRIEINERN